MSLRVSGEPAMLVAGGSGGVGRAIVAALLKRDIRVIVPLREDASEARLRDYLRELPLERLTLLRGEIADVADGHRIATSLRDAYGQLDGVAAALGGWWTGEPLVELRRETWGKLVADNLTAHLAVVQAFFPLLREAAGRYVAIGGGAAYAPVPASGPISILAAAQLMMTRVLYEEEQPRSGGVDIRELVVNGAIATDPDSSHGQPFAAREIGEIVADLLLTGATRCSTVRIDGPILNLLPG